MNGWEAERHKRLEIEVLLQAVVWCIPIPFLMGLKVGIDFYILGPAYFLAMIRQKQWQIPALIAVLVGIILLPTEEVRWKYGVLVAVLWIVEQGLDRYRPTWPYAKRCVFYVLGLLMVVIGLALAGVWAQYQIVAVFLEAVFLLGAAGLYQSAVDQKKAADELAVAGVSLVQGSILAAFHGLQVGQVIPSEIMLISLSIAGGYELGIGKGMVLCMPAALFMRLTMTAGEGLVIVSVLAVLMAGGFRELGRRAAVSAVFSGCSLWLLLFMGGSSVTSGILTVGLACLVFGILQRRLLGGLVAQVKKEEEKLRYSFDARKRYMEHQMAQSAQALRQIAQLIAIPPKQKKITGQDLVYLKEDIAGSLCVQCNKQKICWGKQYACTHETVLCIMEASRFRGKVERKDLPNNFLETCDRASDFVKAVNRHYELYRLNQSWENRMAQSAQLMQGQYEAMAVYMDQLREHFAGELEAEERLRQSIVQHLKRQGVNLLQVTVMADERENRIWIHLETGKELSRLQGKHCIRLISELTQRPIVQLEAVCLGENRFRYRFSDPNVYCLQLGCVVGNSEEISGDSYTARRLDAQRFVVALGDGMGSGHRAHETSEKALSLLEQMLLSGADEEQAVQMLNTVLVLSTQNEIFTTIDMALLNLHTGELKLVKAGGCTTFLRSRAAVYVYRSESLPVGILDEPQPEIYCCSMTHGDVMLMISDGVLDQLPEPKQGERWIKRYLLQSKEEDPQVLAEEIRQLLQPHLPQVEDDQTILAVRIEKKKNLC